MSSCLVRIKSIFLLKKCAKKELSAAERSKIVTLGKGGEGGYKERKVAEKLKFIK